MNIFKFIDSTIYGRHKIDALNLFNESKFFGVGNKNFRIICNKDKYDFLSSDEFKDSLCTTHPHQFYYELLSEHGLAGITVFILMFLLFFKKFIVPEIDLIISCGRKSVIPSLYLKKNSKKIVFLSNAPRPSSNVINFLLKMKMDKKYLENVMTSGEAAMHAINQKKFGKTFFHLGPARDTSIFEKVKDNKTDLQSCDFILCTGLFDDHDNNLDYYKKFLEL